MKRNLWILAIACLLLPLIVTYTWFYSGMPRTVSAPMPDYSNIDFPRPTLSTEIPDAKPPARTTVNVVLDLQHQNMYSVSEIDPLIRAIESFGGSIQTTSEQTNLESSLKSADVYICITPILRFNQLEITQITNFVKRGGKLVVFTDPTRNASATLPPVSDTGGGGAALNTMLSGTDNANLILEPFDISFSDDYLYNMTENEGNFRNLIINELTDDALTIGIKQLVIYGGHSVHSGGVQLVKTGKNTYSSAGEVDETYSIADLVKSGSGSVLAIGDLSLVTSQYVRSSDNQVFTQNLAKFITSTPRQKTLVDFPVVFTGAVVMQPAGKMEVNGDLVSAASSLETYLQLPSGGLTITQKADGTADRILVTTLSETDATREIFKSLKINLAPKLDAEKDVTPTPTASSTLGPTPTPASGMSVTGEGSGVESTLAAGENETSAGPDTIEMPYFGQIKTKDLGLVGLTHTGGKTTLVIMAATPANAQAFIRNLATGGLNGCIVHDDLAACKVTDFTVPPQG